MPWTKHLAGLVACALAAMLLASLTYGQTWPARLLRLPYGDERLWHALSTGNTAQLERAIAEGANLDAPNPFGFGNTPLVMAAGGDHPEMVRQLLRRGANPDQPNELGITPLLSAILADRVELAELLLAAGASPRGTAARDRVPLVTAVRVGNPVLVELLLDAGADVNAQTFGGVAALDVAVESGSDHLAGLLRHRGASRASDCSPPGLHGGSVRRVGGQKNSGEKPEFS